MPEAPESPAELLVRAVNGLPDADRDRVLAWLLGRIPMAAPSPGSGWPQLMAPPALPELSRIESLIARFGPLRGEHQAVPVRLPARQHALLREWCAEHSFTMATVIRGLVDRFLEDRGLLPPPGAADEPAG